MNLAVSDAANDFTSAPKAFFMLDDKDRTDDIAGCLYDEHLTADHRGQWNVQRQWTWVVGVGRSSSTSAASCSGRLASTVAELSRRARKHCRPTQNVV